MPSLQQLVLLGPGLSVNSAGLPKKGGLKGRLFYHFIRSQSTGPTFSTMWRLTLLTASRDSVLACLRSSHCLNCSAAAVDHWLHFFAPGDILLYMLTGNKTTHI